MKQRSKLRLFVAVIILLISIGVFLWASWPVSRQSQILPLPTIEIPLSTPTVLLNILGWG